jgi:non-specific serine/threonine protein kinase
MLETVRDYAQQRLRDSGDSAAVHNRLADYLIDVATGLDTARDATLQNTLRRLDAEHDNVRVALAWCESEPARSLKGLRLAALLLDFWRVRGRYSEGLTWLARLQAPVSAGERGETHAMALHASGTLLGIDSNQGAAAARLREALDLWRQLGDRRRAARSQVCLAEVEWYGGNAVSAQMACAEALPISRELGDLRNVADALLYSAEMARIAGDYNTAQGLLDECLTVSQGIGGWALAAAYAYMAALEYSRGDYARARSTWRQSLPGYREFGDRQGTCAALMCIAIVSQELGDLPAAISCLRESWDWLPRGNDNESLYWLDAFAGLLVALHNAADAARVWGCVERHRQERGLERPDLKRYLRMLDAARSALHDEIVFKRAWGEGRSWSLDEAEQFARRFMTMDHMALDQMAALSNEA